MDVIAERRFQTLKKKLDSLRYPQPLSLDSVPLVEVILTDLLKTVEGFNQLKRQLSEAQVKIQGLTDSVVPLQNELILTQKKNNELHLQLMSTKEATDSKTSAWLASVSKLKEENKDLNFYIKKLKNDLSRQESSNSDLRTQLDVLIGKTYTSQKPAADGFIGKTQVFEMNTGLVPPKSLEFAKPDSVWANELRAADERAKSQQTEIETIGREKGLLEDEVKRLSILIKNRDLEIARLTGMIGADFKAEMITSKYRKNMKNANIDQMNDRIDLLNNENFKLESELAKARQGLDRFCELEKENKYMVESLSQLRSQNNSLMLKLAELERLGKSLSVQTELDQLKTANLDLLHRNKALENEVLKSQDEARRSEYKLRAVSADKQVYLETNARSGEEIQEIRTQMRDLDGLLKDTQEELKNIREREIKTEGKALNLKKELESIQQTYSRMNKDHLSATEEAYQLRQKLASLESQKNDLQAELENSNFETDRLTKLKKISEEQLENTKNELALNRTELASTSAQKQKIGFLLDAAQKELASLKEENSYLIRLREKDKQALIQAEDRERDLSSQLGSALYNSRAIQKEHQDVSEELSGRLEEMRKVALIKSSFEQELADLRPFKLKYQQAVEEVTSLKTLVLHKDSVLSKLQRNIDSLEDALRAREINLAEQSKQVIKLEEEINRLESEIDSMKEHNFLLSGNAKQTEYLLAEAHTLKQQLSEYREREREHIRQTEQYRSELKKAAEALKSLQKTLSRQTEQKIALEQEAEKQKQVISEMQSRDLLGQNEHVKLEEKLFNSEIMIEELKRQVGLEQHNRYRAEDEVSSLKSILENEKSSSARLFEQNTQLKSLISNLEKTKEDLLTKISVFSSDKSADDGQKSQLISEISVLRKELAHKAIDNSKLTQEVKSIDEERDYIQSLLDKKTEEMHLIEISLASSQKEIAVLKDTVNSLQSKDSTRYKRFEEKDFQIKKLAEKSRHQESELEDLKSALTGNSRQIQELNEHLLGLTKENQFINEQLMKVSHEKEGLKKLFDDKAKNERLSQQQVRSVEREKEDLLLACKKTCDENERLNQAVAAVTGEQRDAYLKLQVCEKELANAQNHISIQEHEIFNLRQDVNSLERQVSHLNFQLETAQRKNQDVSEIKESFMREVSGVRQIALNIEASKDDLIRKLSVTENDKLILESKTRSLQSEISAVKSQLDFEKQKSEQLQLALAKEKEVLFKTQKDLGRAEMNKGIDEEFVNNQLQVTRNQLMNLEMENLKLKEENGRNNHKIHKFEGKIKELEGQLNKTSAAFKYADDWDS